MSLIYRWVIKRGGNEADCRTEQKKDASGDYPRLLAGIKERIRSAQYEALKAVNRELVGLYWDIGQMIVEGRPIPGGGKAVVEQLAAEIRAEFPGVNGFFRDLQRAGKTRTAGARNTPTIGWRNQPEWKKNVGALI